MNFILKDARGRLYKISYSSREALMTDIKNALAGLQQKYRQKRSVNKQIQALIDQVYRIREGDPKLDSLVDQLEKLEEIKSKLLKDIQNTHFILGENLEDRLYLNNFLGIADTIELPEIYEDNCEELRTLVFSMIKKQ